MLKLSYDSGVPRAMIETMEHHGRRLGVALDALERLGQSLDTVEGFILACESGWGYEYAQGVWRDGAPPAAVPVSVTACSTPRAFV